MGKLVINGNQVYEIDEECMKKKEQEEQERLEQEKSGTERHRRQRGNFSGR